MSLFTGVLICRLPLTPLTSYYFLGSLRLEFMVLHLKLVQILPHIHNPTLVQILYLSRLFCVKCSLNLMKVGMACHKAHYLDPIFLRSIPILSFHPFLHCHSITTYTLMIASCLFPSSLIVLLETSLTYKLLSVP